MCSIIPHMAGHVLGKLLIMAVLGICYTATIQNGADRPVIDLIDFAVMVKRFCDNPVYKRSLRILGSGLCVHSNLMA